MVEFRLLHTVDVGSLSNKSEEAVQSSTCLCVIDFVVMVISNLIYHFINIYIILHFLRLALSLRFTVCLSLSLSEYRRNECFQ